MRNFVGGFAVGILSLGLFAAIMVNFGPRTHGVVKAAEDVPRESARQLFASNYLDVIVICDHQNNNLVYVAFRDGIDIELGGRCK